jgi:Domain of unknown function (DUF4440)
MKIFLNTFLMAMAVAHLNAQALDDKEVAGVVELFRVTLIDPTRSVLENILSEELSYGHSSGKIDDKPSFITSLVEGKSDFISIEITDLTIKVVGTMALVRHKMQAQIMDNGKPSNVNLGVLLVWIKKHKKWELMGRQAYKL